MKSIYNKIGAVLMGVLLLASCQDKDLPGNGAIVLPTPDAATIKGAVSGANGYDYTLTWPAPATGTMQVAVYRNGMQQQGLTPYPTNTFTLTNLPTHEPYEFVFKLSDGTNTSHGTIIRYTRPGAYAVKDLKMESVDNGTAFSAKGSWPAVSDATKINVTATNGTRTETATLDGSATEYVVTGCAKDEVWKFTLVAENDGGKALPTEGSVKVGRTAVGFLSIYDTPEELVKNGDDDEASAWLWLHQQYPDADFLPFKSIDALEKLQKYRVLWWLRDMDDATSQDDIWNMPEVVNNATPFIQQWFKDGGSLLLWSYATPYIGTIGRLDMSLLKNNDHAFDMGKGSVINDIWKMGVGINPGGKFSIDFSSHPLYSGLNPEKGERCMLLPVKGAGWTENHNCLFFNIPAVLTGKENQDEECYNIVTKQFGIYPLGVWDSQIDWVSQLNVWEAQPAPQAPAGFEQCGTVICIGNGGCEFSMKNLDGTNDVSANPKNNPYQATILKMAVNAIEYLKTR